MLKAFKYELCPTEDQKTLFNKHFGSCRYIYNWALAQKQKVYAEEKRTISCFELMAKLPALKKEKEWLSEVSSMSLQQSISHLDTAFTAFFKKNSKFPEFKAKHKSRLSYSIPQGVSVDHKKSTMFIPKLKEIKFYRDRPFVGQVRTCTVSKTATGRYLISVLVEDNKPVPDKCPVTFNKTIGIDVGVKDFAILSNGDKFSNPKFLIKQQRKLAVTQRRLSRKVKGSKRYNKQRVKIARIHEKVTNQRKDFQHKISTMLVRENQAICMEDLNVGGLLKNQCLARSISDVAWAQFIGFVSYKSDWYGKNFVQIGRFDPSSKMCSSCGKINHNLKLSDRQWVCSCGAKHDRDVNAAINIKNFGFVKLNKLGAEDKTPSINKARRRDGGPRPARLMARTPRL